MEQLALSELFDTNNRPNINSWYTKIKKMNIFKHSVTVFIPKTLIDFLTKCGEEQKQKVLKLIEDS